MTIIALKHHSEFAYKIIFSEYVHILNIDNSRKNKHFPALLSLQQIKSNLQLAHAIKSSLLQHTPILHLPNQRTCYALVWKYTAAEKIDETGNFD